MESIKKNKDFSYIFKKGCSFANPAFICYYKENRNRSRFAVVAGKKVGNAVKRNRAKRVIRAALRDIIPEIKNNYDIIFIARQSTLLYKSSDVFKMMEKSLLGRLNKK